VRTTALLLRFLLDLALVASAAYLGWALADGGWRLPVAVLAPAAVIALWGTLLSPKARVTVPGWTRVTLEVLLFCGAEYLIWQTGAWSRCRGGPGQRERMASISSRRNRMMRSRTS
jgi:hypothetical protein